MRLCFGLPSVWFESAKHMDLLGWNDANQTTSLAWLADSRTHMSNRLHVVLDSSFELFTDALPFHATFSNVRPTISRLDTFGLQQLQIYSGDVNSNWLVNQLDQMFLPCTAKTFQTFHTQNQKQFHVLKFQNQEILRANIFMCSSCSFFPWMNFPAVFTIPSSAHCASHCATLSSIKRLTIPQKLCRPMEILSTRWNSLKCNRVQQLQQIPSGESLSCIDFLLASDATNPTAKRNSRPVAFRMRGSIFGTSNYYFGK